MLNHTPATKDEVKKLVKGMSPSEVVRFNYDKLAFGFTEGDELTLPLRKLKVKYKEDMKNVRGFNMSKYFGGVPFNELPPIEVTYEKSVFYVSDGHHRYGYAVQLGLESVPVVVEKITDNPVTALGFKSIDEIVKLAQSHSLNEVLHKTYCESLVTNFKKLKSKSDVTFTSVSSLLDVESSHYNKLKSGVVLHEVLNKKYYFFNEGLLYVVSFDEYVDENNNTSSSINFQFNEKLNSSSTLEDFFSEKNFSYKSVKHESPSGFWSVLLQVVQHYSVKYSVKYFNFFGSTPSETKKSKKASSTNYVVQNELHSLLLRLLLQFQSNNNSVSRANLYNLLRDYCNSLVKQVTLKTKTIESTAKKHKKELKLFGNSTNLLRSSLNSANYKSFVLQYNYLVDNYSNFEKVVSLLLRSLYTKEQELSANYSTLVKNPVDTSVLRKTSTVEKETLDDHNETLVRYFDNYVNVLDKLEDVPGDLFKSVLKNTDVLLTLRELLSYGVLLRLLYTFEHFTVKVLNTSNTADGSTTYTNYVSRALKLFSKVLTLNKLRFSRHTFFKVQQLYFEPLSKLAKDFKQQPVSKEQFTKALDNTLREVARSSKYVELHYDYKSRLQQFVNKVPLHVLHEPNNVVYFTVDVFTNSYEDNNVGYLLSLKEAGVVSFFNTRDKLYYKALLSYGVPKSKVWYDGNSLNFEL